MGEISATNDARSEKSTKQGRGFYDACDSKNDVFVMHVTSSLRADPRLIERGSWGRKMILPTVGFIEGEWMVFRGAAKNIRAVLQSLCRFC
jgi:hypothetical protein